MTEVIRPKFDIVRGWAGGGSLGSAYDRTFSRVVDGGGAPIKVRQGAFLTWSDVVPGAMKLADTTATDVKSDYEVYLVVEGNDPADSYSGDFLNKVVCIKGSYEVLVSNTPGTSYNMYVAGAYAPGSPVTIAAGFINLWTSGKAKMGYVTDVDAANATLKVAFSV